ncbi:MAG: 50S ribosomal protein L11 methyltransferase [Bacteroidales bacterium]|nr:50S ribosomal protein L11 methyltransferase [Bacteroidales bacterium]MDY6427161.1 50S ribosomal protein L11 methyltransferase [Bacteroidales bacterium]
MQYVKISISLPNCSELERDTLIYYLSEAGCDSFETDESASMLYAYIGKTIYNPQSLNEVLDGYACSVEDMEDRDWNEEWEKSGFTPIVIDNRCVICGSNHTDVPDAEYRITINPKMSFGSGHHQTTASMLRWLLRDNFRGKRVLDMGCGTAVLGILASMRGASEVDGIDIDEWSVRNARENCALSGVNMNILLGDTALLASQGKTYNAIFANINLNILLRDMEAYCAALEPKGVLYMSGFYTSDLSQLSRRAKRLGLEYLGSIENEDWVAAKFVKL